MSDPLGVLLREVESLFAPLLEAGDNPDALFALLRRIGWTLTETLPDVTVLAQAFADARSAVDTVRAVVDGGQPDFNAFARALDAASGVPQALDRLATDVAALAPPEAAQALAELPSDLLELLLLDALGRRAPLLLALLRTAGLVQAEPVATVTGAGGRRLREAIVVERLKPQSLPDWISDPAEQARQRFGMAPVVDVPSASAWALRVFPLLAQLVQALGGQASQGRGAGALRRLSADDERTLAHMLQVAWALPLAGTANADTEGVLGAVLAVVPPEGSKAAGLAVSPFGDASFTLTSVSGWTGTLGVQAAADALVFRATGTELPTDAAGRFEAQVGLERAGSPLRIGSAGGTRLELGTVALKGSVAVQPQQREFKLGLEVGDAAFVLSGGDGDGFLAKALPRDAFISRFRFGLSWSNLAGFAFSGSAGLQARLDIQRSLAGIVELHSLWLGLAATADNGPPALSGEAALSGSVKLGPVVASFDRIGLRAELSFPPGGGNAGPAALALSFKPPGGLGLKIDAGPVTGGGYLFFDLPAEQYGGVVQLSIRKTLALNAIALITTRLPGLPQGQKGFSMLLVITAEFPPLPLGFGFTLNGVGGLIGINRTMALDPLRDSVRDRSIEGILFPQNPLANASSLVAALQGIFPPAEGRVIFGPMVKVGWGPTQLITIEAALILELPAPLRLVLLGRMRAVLPDKSAPVVDLRLDVVGVLDFDRSEASIDASFVDSRLAGFVLTGDMALRLGWGPAKSFALAAGGFNPRFTPPPGFPRLRRLALSLADGDNPRFRLESYLALTSNTIQFGARAELSVHVETAIGDFGAAAMLFFDALVELDPFGFIVDLGASIEVTLASRPLLQAQLMATLSGTKPWHAVGFVEVVFLGRHRIPFEARAGDPTPTTLPTVDVLKLLRDEIARVESWATVPPEAATELVVLRDAGGGATGGLLHPLGRVGLRQRLLPLGKRLERFGSAVPEGGAASFTLAALDIGGSTQSVAPLDDDFAPGQYESLSDDDKLARPAFERMQAGGEAAAPAALQLPMPNASTGRVGTAVSIDYEEVVIDRRANPSRQPRRRQKAVMARGLVSAMADDGAVGAPDFRGPGGLAIAVRGERWRVADADHLGTLPGAALATSASEAHDRRRLSGMPEERSTVVALHELS